MSLDNYLGKKYVLLENCAGWDELLKQLGASLFYRKMAGVIKPTIELTKNERTGLYVFSAKSTYRDATVKFRPGVPVQCRSSVDSKTNVECVFAIRGKCLVEVQTNPTTGEKLAIKWHFRRSTVEACLYFKKVKATRRYRVIGSTSCYMTGSYDAEKDVQSDSSSSSD